MKKLLPVFILSTVSLAATASMTINGRYNNPDLTSGHFVGKISLYNYISNRENPACQVDIKNEDTSISLMVSGKDLASCSGYAALYGKKVSVNYLTKPADPDSPVLTVQTIAIHEMMD